MRGTVVHLKDKTAGFRIDGNSAGATLMKTSMGEKETLILGTPTVLQPPDRPESGAKQERCGLALV